VELLIKMLKVELLDVVLAGGVFSSLKL